MEDLIEITEYKDEWAGAFKRLNIAWLQKYFYVEPVDEELLSDPKQHILNKGGHIYFAVVANEVAGTFALIDQGNGSFELGKMAVDEAFQGRKIGNRMLEFCLQKAKELGAGKVILYSNTLLSPAIHLYRKYGFTEVPMEHSIYKRANIKMERPLD